jgi:IclR family transcriptional regulator, acetate operon repressor
VSICGQCSRSTGAVNLRNVERALALVEKILLEPPATQAELMRNLQIPRSTISDLLAELRSTGYVNVLDNRHVPGPQLLSLILRAARVSVMPAAIRDILQKLAEQLGETAIFVIGLPGTETSIDHVMALEQAESPHDLRYVGDIGRLFVAKNTVAGHALLAFHDPEANQLGSEERAVIRQRGFALVEDDSRGATRLAAPILDSAGRPIGAISVIGPAVRMRDPVGTFWPALRDAVAQIGATMGKKIWEEGNWRNSFTSVSSSKTSTPPWKSSPPLSA